MPGCAGGGYAVWGSDGAVGVLCCEEFDDGHGEGGEDADGDQGTEDAGDEAETADERFEVLERSV